MGKGYKTWECKFFNSTCVQKLQPFYDLYETQESNSKPAKRPVLTRIVSAKGMIAGRESRRRSLGRRDCLSNGRGSLRQRSAEILSFLYLGPTR